MKANGHESPRIPIPGAAGAAVFAALHGLVMQSGGGAVTIIKKPVAGGSYVYEIARDRISPSAVKQTDGDLS